jgi:hypothetical protein
MLHTTSLLLLLVLMGVAQGSITIVDSGKMLASKPVRKLGERLGRLQYVQGNMQLCQGLDPHSKFRITVPSDGLPGELVGKLLEPFLPSVLYSTYSIVSFLLQSHSSPKREVAVSTKKRSLPRR